MGAITFFSSKLYELSVSAIFCRQKYLFRFTMGHVIVLPTSFGKSSSWYTYECMYTHSITLVQWWIMQLYLGRVG